MRSFLKHYRFPFMPVAVWLCRIAVGVTFILAGWAKAIDPWGFILKVGEYLNVWAFHVPDEIIVAGCGTLACVEFCTGVLVLTGSFKRWAVWTVLAMMAAMLPLTLYIAVLDPVADCGCFGDFIVISNWATFIKNIVITAGAVFLVFKNKRCKGLFPLAVQWVVLVASVLFPLYLAILGYNVQPMVDFRPYKVGVPVFGAEDDNEDIKYIYTKEGSTGLFTLDSLPDSTWTFVGEKQEAKSIRNSKIAVFDDNGEEVEDEIVPEDSDLVIFTVPQPDVNFLSRSRLIKDISEYCHSNNIAVFALLGGGQSQANQWKAWVRPQFPVYTAEDTSVEMLARGKVSLVYVRNGNVVWKRTLSSIDCNLFSGNSTPEALYELGSVDNGRMHLLAVIVYIGFLLVLWVITTSPRVIKAKRKLCKKSKT